MENWMDYYTYAYCVLSYSRELAVDYANWATGVA